MARLLVCIIILLDLAAWLGVNLPFHGVHLDLATRHALNRFNIIILIILIVALLAALLMCLFPPGPARRPSRWPQEPPD